MLISLKSWGPKRRPNITGSRTPPAPFVTDAQWNLIKHLFEEEVDPEAPGRPRIDPRRCLEGISWVLKSGARWKAAKELTGPDRYPSSTTCWRRHRDWSEAVTLTAAWQTLLARVAQVGVIAYLGPKAKRQHNSPML